MKIIALFLLLLTVTTACNKENNDDLFVKYQPVYGIWKPLTISYDSMDVRVTWPIQYDRLVINNNLSYKIFLDASNTSIEDGTITIISQTEDTLEIYFAAKYPPYSSFAGSHIFGISNVVLDASL
jgi:hypothetical protein